MDSVTGAVTRVIWRFAQCEYDELQAQLWVEGKKVDLHPKTQAVLLALLRSKGHKLTKRDLLREVWGSADAVEQPLANAIARLRTAVSPDERDRVIRTIHGLGFQIVVPVERRVVEETVYEGTRLAGGDSIPGKRDWKLLHPLDPRTPHRVWLAQRPATGHTHVFRFAEEGGALQKLRKEVDAFRRLEQSGAALDGFVQIFDWRDTTKPYFIEMEYAGQSLVEWAESQRKTVGLRAEVCLQVFIDLVDAVVVAHNCGILHNKIQPENVLIASPLGVEERWRVKLTNFSSATWDVLEQGTQSEDPDTRARNELEGNTAGAGVYQAPEIAAGVAATRSSDVYSLGIILFQLLCGDFRRPLTPDWENFIDDPTIRGDIAEATSSDPKRRIRSAAELADRLRTREARSERERETARELQLARERAEAAERQLTARNARRPWIAAAILLLVAGVCTSLWFYRKATQGQDIADSRSAMLAAMNDFLTIDLIGQSNPLVGLARPGPVKQETLLDAIDRVLPQIDYRFDKSPEIAGQLHEAIAGALDARTEYAAADREFATAAERFRQAEGPLSENAIIAELRRETAQMRTQIPASIRQAKAGFHTQQQLIAKLRYVSPDLQAWQALAQTASLIFGSRPEDGLRLLSDAVARAETTPGFSPSLLIALKTRFAGIYLRLNDGPNAERAARDVIHSVTALYGQDSPALFQPDMYLEEALFLQGKFEQTAEQSGRDYARFLQSLGPENQLTLAALFMRAQAEGSIEDYSDAIRDELDLYTAERSNPSGRYIQEDSLSSAASLECHSGRLKPGIDHAQQAIRESSSEPAPQPLFSNFSSFTEAECLISQAEVPRAARRPATLEEADRLLRSVDLRIVSSTAGFSDFEGAVDVAKARLALLRGRDDAARAYINQAAPFMAKPGTDPYEKSAFTRVEALAAR